MDFWIGRRSNRGSESRVKNLVSIEDNRRYADKVFLTKVYDKNPISPGDFAGRTCYVLTDRPELSRLGPEYGSLIQDLSGLTDQQVSEGVFYIYFTYDSDALPLLKEIRRRGGVFVAPDPMMVAGNKSTYCYGINRLAHQAMEKTWARGGVTHLHVDVQQNICEALDITRSLEGDFVEIGVYRGGSACTALNFIDEMFATRRIQPRHCWLMDTFDGFTYEEAQNSIDPLWKNTHRLSGVESTQNRIRQVLSPNQTPYSLHANNICRDPLPEGIKRIVVAHVDVDMYEPTLAALQKVSERMVPGGIIMCEDPPSTPSLYGALLAMEEFLDSEQGNCYTKVFKGGHYFLIKRT